MTARAPTRYAETSAGTFLKPPACQRSTSPACLAGVAWRRECAGSLRDVDPIVTDPLTTSYPMTINTTTVNAAGLDPLPPPSVPPRFPLPSPARLW